MKEDKPDKIPRPDHQIKKSSPRRGAHKAADAIGGLRAEPRSVNAVKPTLFTQ